MELLFADVLGLFVSPKPLKAGGQKAVFTVDHNTHEKAVLKIGIYSDKSNLERIVREVQLLQEIDSVYYPKNFEFVVIDDKRFYILEEFFPGDMLSNCQPQFYEIPHALHLILEITKGLSVLWERKVVHRDVKPENIIITPDGDIKIIDLGIARILDFDSLTNVLAMRGPCTPVYAAPEQLLNRKADIDFRTDQFQLGIILVQMILKGQHPFAPDFIGGSSIVENLLSGSTVDYLQNSGHELLNTLIRKMLSREPYQRYRKPEILVKKIEECIDFYGEGL